MSQASLHHHRKMYDARLLSPMSNNRNNINNDMSHLKMAMYNPVGSNMPSRSSQVPPTAASLPKGLLDLNFLPQSSVQVSAALSSSNAAAIASNTVDTILNEVVHDTPFDLKETVSSNNQAKASSTNDGSLSMIVFDTDDCLQQEKNTEADILPCPISPCQDDIKVVENVQISDNSWTSDEDMQATILSLLTQEKCSINDTSCKKRKANDDIENVVHTIDDIDVLGDDDLFAEHDNDDGMFMMINNEEQQQTSNKRAKIQQGNHDSLLSSMFNTSDSNYNSDSYASANEDETSSTKETQRKKSAGRKKNASKVTSGSASVTSSLPTPSNCERYSRNDQSEKWTERYHDLIQYRAVNGHCNVPHKLESNQQLAQWVKRQRYQYKLKTQYKKHSTLTDEREALLNNLGFVWDSHKVLWDERFEELKVFKSKVGHCRVPCNFKYNRPLSIWVKCQRRQYKLYQMNQPTNMTLERIQRLNAIGFAWDPRTAS